MTNVATLPNSATALDRIVVEIAKCSTDMVLGAYRIGALLNEAKEIIADDVQFGRWRSDKLSDLGLNRRVAQRMQNLAARFETEGHLPTGVGLSALYDMSGTEVSDTVQERTLKRVTEYQAENGEAPTYRQVANMLVEEKDAERRMDKDGNTTGTLANERRVEERVAEQARERARNGGRQAAQEVAEEEQKVDELLRYLARNRCVGKRTSAVARLMNGLRAAQLVTVSEGIVACANQRTGRFEFTLEDES